MEWAVDNEQPPLMPRYGHDHFIIGWGRRLTLSDAMQISDTFGTDFRFRNDVANINTL